MITENCKKDRIEIKNKLTEVNDEYEKYEVGEVVTDYIDIMIEELDKQYSIQRFSDKEVIINKYIEEAKVKCIGSVKENFRIEVKLSLKDDFEELTNNTNKSIKGKSNKNGKNSIYISNLKSFAIW